MSLDFSGLVNVGGNLNIQYLNDPSYVSHNLSFPLLETIGGNFYVYYYYGENLIAPCLTTGLKTNLAANVTAGVAASLARA